MKLNHKGVGIATAIGIVALVLAITSSLLTYAVFQANLVDKNIERTEAYANAMQSVDATLNIIARDQNFDPAYFSDLGAFMGVTISAYSDTVYTVTSLVTTTKEITSYFSGSASVLPLTSSVFDYTGQEPDFSLDPLITPTNIMAQFIPIFIQTTFPSITPQTEFTDFNSIMTYLFSLTQSTGSYSLESPSIITNQSNPVVSGHWYINGDVSLSRNQDLFIPEGYFLIIDGNLNLGRDSEITGNIIIDGTLDGDVRNSIDSQLQGTFYVSGDVLTAKSTSFGTSIQPTFVLCEGKTVIANDSTGYGYFLSNKFTGNSKSIVITGGIYPMTPSNFTKTIIYPNTTLDVNNFFDYAIPSEVPSSDGGGSGFIFTTPKMN